MQTARPQPVCVLLLVALAIAAFTQPAGAGAGAAAPQQQQEQLHPNAQQQRNAAAALQPPTWPEQFKSVMFQNRTNKLALVTLYYDWRAGANLNIISSQLGAAGTVWDLEWNNGAWCPLSIILWHQHKWQTAQQRQAHTTTAAQNMHAPTAVAAGTSFIFSRDQPVCKTLHFDVGILTPDWLADSKYLGQTAADNFVTNVWTKAEFINYYADKVRVEGRGWAAAGVVRVESGYCSRGESGRKQQG